MDCILECWGILTLDKSLNASRDCAELCTDTIANKVEDYSCTFKKKNRWDSLENHYLQSQCHWTNVAFVEKHFLPIQTLSSFLEL